VIELFGKFQVDFGWEDFEISFVVIKIIYNWNSEEFCKMEGDGLINKAFMNTLL